ncbi:hypothetical protein MKW92_031926 [Papaver armeniacum]|nr:hypothetical protein MKW92_031926 [Papaver armeniacum]
MGNHTDKVRFNVRGKIFETTATTLATECRNSIFGAMFDDAWKLQPRESVNGEEYFMDRDPDCFSVLLNLLGTGGLDVPSNVPEKLLYREAHYYGLLDRVRKAKWGEFDSSRLSLAHTVSGRAPNDCEVISASPDGGCAVAHGGVVRVYDWMLEEHPPLNLDYQRVNDIGWIDSDNIVITVRQNLSRGVGGMGIFSSSTGELKHRFQLTDGKDQVKGFTAGVLCLNSEGKIFAKCKDTDREGIGVWDQATEKQINFFKSFDGSCLDDVRKIQWLDASNCLFVHGVADNQSHINLLDFRDKNMVWSWPDDTKPSQSSYVQDIIPMEESNTICVVDLYGTLGFLDLRGTKQSVRWNSNRGGEILNSYCPKLKFHGGQLFCSTDDKISVYCDALDQWVSTSSLERSQGGLLRDFSIGGDRLFALHREKNVFDVWETPSAPII